ncbi:ArsR/SmtB family transcription factor [Mycetocola zhadangensis]|uniref:Transcriptional regulator n=1 Tax=Mycetocola zhadangensis TaxID=1164595 RepID=A0A3L7IS36_9MICO|nr:DUF5937 family protein [Mycetocola zhadangensis]RLQ80996.1 transcriptional regulator [Mycetocola zhadangensis]GGF03864.1 transcriptional regulator [Mycetocola zhadangensis]
MLRYQLSESDLGGVRFGISPLCELGLSLRSVSHPERYPLQLPWLARTESLRRDLDGAALSALVNERLWTPDFLNPRPASPLTRIDDEFAVLDGISSQTFRSGLLSIHTELPDVFAGPPKQAIRRMTSALREYWEACLKPHWPRMRAILEADIVHRGRVIAHDGLAAMLNGISSAVSYERGVVSVALSAPDSRIEHAGGSGVTLVPTMFTRRASAPIGAGEAPLIMYPARGQGTMWAVETGQRSTALENLIGARRTELLTALRSPASSTELGIRFGISASAVNQHLRALADAGLVTSTRYGHSVLYFRSELGQALSGA